MLEVFNLSPIEVATVSRMASFIHFNLLLSKGNKVPPFFCPKINSFSSKANLLLFCRRGWQTFSLKDQKVKYHQLCRLILPLQRESNHRHDITKGTWLCSNKTLLTKTGSQIDCGDGFMEVHSSPNLSGCIHSFTDSFCMWKTFLNK